MPSKTKQSTTAKKADATKDAPSKKASPAEGTSAKTASAGKGTSGKKVNPALMKPLQPSNELAAVVGSDPLPRPEVVSKVWDYIKKNQLQDPQNKREIVADDKLRAVFGKERVTMFEMNKHLAQHLK
jgi:chromatin remodeling complex protein RSC6